MDPRASRSRLLSPTRITHDECLSSWDEDFPSQSFVPENPRKRRASRSRAGGRPRNRDFGRIFWWGFFWMGVLTREFLHVVKSVLSCVSIFFCGENRYSSICRSAKKREKKKKEDKLPGLSQIEESRCFRRLVNKIRGK